MVDHERALDAVLGAAASTIRRDMLARLSRGPMRVTDLARHYPVSLNAVSKHTKVLESAGLVHRVVHGREHTLHLRAEPLRQASRWLAAYEQFWSERLDALAELLEAPLSTPRRSRRDRNHTRNPS